MAESIDEVRRAEQRRIAKEKRRIMMKERRKAIRAGKQRLKDAKMKKSVKFGVRWKFKLWWMKESVKFG